MRHITLLSALFVACALHAADHTVSSVPDARYFSPAVSSGTVETATYTNSEGVEKHACVYLPADYTPERRYDVLYLIHGFTDSAEWFFGTEDRLPMKYLIDNMIADGLCRPVIIVCPTWNPDNNQPAAPWDVASAQVEAFYSEYVNDLIPAIESRYSTWADATDRDGITASREHRAAGGFSMGAVATWSIMAEAFDCQRLYMPLSCDCWYYGEFGGANSTEKTAALLASAVTSSDYDCRIWCGVGGNDSLVLNALEKQIGAMQQRPDVFGADVLTFCISSGGQHNHPTVMELFFNGMQSLFPPQPQSALDETAAVCDGDAAEAAYTLNGLPAGADSRGIVVSRGEKTIRNK